jgi:hypothetical protein
MKGARLLILVPVLLALISLPAAAASLHSAPLRDFVAGPCGPGASYDPACDVNRDGNMDLLDIQLTAGRWGQTGTWTPELGAAPPCFDNANRYVDCGNGTVTDTVTGLIWLKSANCFGSQNYAAANNAAAALSDGQCSLTDNSQPGDWRLPTKTEWEATIARAVALGCTNPSLTNTSGMACFSAGPQPFTGVPSSGAYWTSTTDATATSFAFYASLGDGSMNEVAKTVAGPDVWPVRGGQ